MVKAFIARAASFCHVELTTLVIPGENDSEEEMRRLSGWVADTCGEETPLHISRFFPRFHMTDRGPTDVRLIYHLAEVAREMGIEPKKDLNVKIGLVGSELLTDAMREEMHKYWGEDMLITSNYGMSELMGPGVSGECEYMEGMHINEDFFIPEIIDPQTGEVLPEGEKGELVITCIKKEGIPLIRYRTKDITRLFYDKCKCGRTFCRMENLSGRSDDMLKIRGVNVFPSQIEEVILSFAELGPHYEIVVERDGYLDKLTIKVELAQATDSFTVLENLAKSVAGKIKTILGLDAKIRLESPNTLQRFEGKAKRVKDLRKV
jgi:phenylacetate-CoA ligase